MSGTMYALVVVVVRVKQQVPPPYITRENEKGHRFEAKLRL